MKTVYGMNDGGKTFYCRILGGETIREDIPIEKHAELDNLCRKLTQTLTKIKKL